MHIHISSLCVHQISLMSAHPLSQLYTLDGVLYKEADTWVHLRPKSDKLR